jgi:hypothetical protein
VIDLLNRYYVPVYVSNEDYRADGSASPEEKKERDGIYREALAAKLSAGTVHAYIVAPDGKVIDSQHVATASKVDQLTAMLERNIERLKTKEGKSIVAPAPQSNAPKAEADSLVLHLTARNLIRKGDELVPQKTTLGETRSGSWGAYPGEDWIVYSKAEWSKLLPRGQVKAGLMWEPDKEAMAKLLNYFYPSTENNDVKKNRMERQDVKATILSIKDGIASARIDGTLRLKHPFYHKDDDNFVEATFVGVVEFEVDKSRVRSLHVATEKAVYGGRIHFGVAVRSVQ